MIFLNKEEEEVYLSLMVAHYLAAGLNQKEIAILIAKSEALVSKLKKKAEEERWIKYSLDIPEDYKEKYSELVQAKTLEYKIKERFPFINKCTITVELRRTECSEKNIEHLLSFEAAKRLEEIVKQKTRQKHTILVSWGKTLYNVINKIYLSQGDENNKFNLSIHPVIGNFSLPEKKEIDDKNFKEVADKTVRYSSNVLAKLLAQRCGAMPPRDLTTVAVIEASDDDLSNCEPVFRADRTLMELYGIFWHKDSNMDGIAAKADTLITSVGRIGPIPEDNDFISAGLIINKKISKKVKGNIIGNLFDEKANPIALENKGKKRQVIGPAMDHIKAISQRHKEKKSEGAGVVVIASEKSKASSIRYLAENNCINELILDFDTAKAVLE